MSRIPAKNDRWPVRTMALCVVALFVLPTGTRADDGPLLPLFGPAELVRSMRLPGASDAIRRPMAVFVDQRHGEIYVGDTMSNRIVIFDREGQYRYQFGCADHIGSPQGIVVDSDGYVFVLGSTRSGQRLVKFDFDGIHLADIDLTRRGIPQVFSIAIDERDDLLLLTGDGSIQVVDGEGEAVRRIEVASTIPDEERTELILGAPVVRDGRLFQPVSNLGHVLVFDYASGEFERSIGVRGNTPGQLNFPVAVDVTSEGIVAVLDRMRFAVVCYSSDDGRFLGEFGGKGFRDGWFYHPNLLAVSDDDHLVVGQMLDGRVQLCRIPRYVRTRLVQASPDRGDDDDGVGRLEATDGGVGGATLRTP